MHKMDHSRLVQVGPIAIYWGHGMADRWDPGEAMVCYGPGRIMVMEGTLGWTKEGQSYGTQEGNCMWAWAWVGVAHDATVDGIHEGP